MRKLKILLTALGAAALVISFQNCGSKMNFSDGASEALSKDLGDGELVLIEDDIDNTLPPEEEIINENPPTEEVVVEEEVVEENIVEEEIIEEEPTTEEIVEEEIVEEEIVADASGDYTCILNGPGDSLKVGYSSGSLDGDNTAIAGAVCVSESACLDILSQVFDVKKAKQMGGCGKNPNRVPLTDAEVASLVADLLG